ncbi:MAG: DUF4160 domain-containing protein [Deltaproteobacteria bacterium]|nr:DUF4160 domain-containing protein [Deltaproteobacteria bacterium]
MPRVSEFFGIAIYLYYRQHEPPHFHAHYGGEQAEIGIEDNSVLRGRLSPRAMGLVTEWATLHREDLRRAWDQTRSHRPPDPIEPLR